MPIGSRLSSILSSTRVLFAWALTFGTGATSWASAESACSAPIATCTLPAAARHHETIATYFHTSGVVTWTTTMEDNCGAPMATCIQPAARVAELPELGLFWHVEHDTTITELLQSWSQASIAHPAWTASEKNWLARRHQPWLSAVALDAVVRLASSVTEADLEHDFIWTHESTRDDVTILRAVPTDETQRLFCPQLRVELDAETRALSAIDVADRSGTWRPIDLPWAVLPKPIHAGETIILTANSIEMDLRSNTSTVTDFPPAPDTLPTLRFAAEQLEFNATAPR